jgi:hypothetical protein
LANLNAFSGVSGFFFRNILVQHMFLAVTCSHERANATGWRGQVIAVSLLNEGTPFVWVAWAIRFRDAQEQSG